MLVFCDTEKKPHEQYEDIKRKINEFHGVDRPTLHVVQCTEQEAEIHMPFCHKEYDEQEKQAQKRFHVYERSWRDVKYWEDSDYPFDWTEGEFC